MFFTWATYGPNILSIVLHYLHFIYLTLFGEILSLSGIKKHKVGEIAKTSTNIQTSKNISARYLI